MLKQKCVSIYKQLSRKWKLGLVETMKAVNQVFFNNFNCFRLDTFQKAVFFSSNSIYGDKSILKYDFDPIELEFVGEKNIIIPFKYINISNIHHTVDSLYLKLARTSSQKVLELVCVKYNFIGEMIFYRNYRYGSLKSVRIS